MKVQVYETKKELDLPFDDLWEATVFLRDLGLFQCPECDVWSHNILQCPACSPDGAAIQTSFLRVQGPQWQAQHVLR
jgi:hypothetical protein